MEENVEDEDKTSHWLDIVEDLYEAAKHAKPAGQMYRLGAVKAILEMLGDPDLFEMSQAEYEWIRDQRSDLNQLLLDLTAARAIPRIDNLTDMQFGDMEDRKSVV